MKGWRRGGGIQTAKGGGWEREGGASPSLPSLLPLSFLLHSPRVRSAQCPTQRSSPTQRLRGVAPRPHDSAPASADRRSITCRPSTPRSWSHNPALPASAGAQPAADRRRLWRRRAHGQESRLRAHQRTWITFLRGLFEHVFQNSSRFS